MFCHRFWFASRQNQRQNKIPSYYLIPVLHSASLRLHGAINGQTLSGFFDIDNQEI